MDSAGKLGLSDVPDHMVWGDMMGLVALEVVVDTISLICYP